MQKNKLPAELIFQIFTLLIGFIIVHAAYVSIIRPQAAKFLVYEQQQLALECSQFALADTFLQDAALDADQARCTRESNEAWHMVSFPCLSRGSDPSFYLYS